MTGLCLHQPMGNIVLTSYAQQDKTETREHLVDFRLSFSFICGIIVRVCRLFLVPKTATFWLLQEYPIHFALPLCVNTIKISLILNFFQA